MRGTLEELGEGHYRLRVFAGRENGKVRHVNRNFKGTKRQAQTALAKLVTEVEQQEVAATGAGKLGELLDRWLEYISPHRADYTIYEYGRLIERTIKPELGHIRVDRVTGRQLDAFYRKLQDRGLSGSSIHQHHSILHASLGRAVKWGLIANNPADRATAPRPARSNASAPAVADVQRLIAAAEADGDAVVATAIALGAVTGARRGELCALRWSDIDWERRMITIARSLTVIRAQPAEGPTKTHQRRDVAVDPAIAALLTARREQQERYAAAVGVELVTDPYVLSRASDGSTPCLPDGLSLAYARLARRLGIVTHFHELRHFSATTAIAAGSDVRTVAGRLGHADPALTLRVYAHALEARDRELASVLGTVVLGPMNGSPKPDEANQPTPPELEGAG
ncbi:MAG TPA: site-specific integrase [Acidimicrobiales bacterium]|nr:site-specific integrase [Acidimicrobiales bacterium]